MATVIHLIEQHPLVSGLAAYWLFSAIVGGAPEPTCTSCGAYRWCYASLHLLAGNVQRAMDARYGSQLGTERGQ